MLKCRIEERAEAVSLQESEAIGLSDGPDYFCINSTRPASTTALSIRNGSLKALVTPT